MTYDEAVKAIVESLWKEVRRTPESVAEQVLDAIGFRQMQEEIENLNVDLGRLQVGGAAELFAKYLDIILKQRDEARVLADRFAATIEKLRTHGVCNFPGCVFCGAQKAWEARSWK